MKMSSPVAGGVIDFDPFSVRSNTDPSMDLGALIELNDYRAFRYGRAGAANISKGKIQLSPAPAANHQNMAVLAAAANQNLVTATPGATAAVSGEYDEGFAIINAGPGIGQTYKVSHNPTITASTAFILQLADLLNVALTTASKLSLVHNTYAGLVEAAVATRRAAGVPLISLTAAYYGFVQVQGVASVLADGVIAVGSDVIPSTSVAGAAKIVDVTSVTTAEAQVKIGKASIVAAVDTEYRPIVLAID